MLIEFQNVSKWFPHSTGTPIAADPYCALVWQRSQRTLLCCAERLVPIRRRREPGDCRFQRRRKEYTAGLGAGLCLPDEGRVDRQRQDCGATGIGLWIPSRFNRRRESGVERRPAGLSKRKTNDLFDRIVEFSRHRRIHRRPVAYLLPAHDLAARFFDRYSMRAGCSCLIDEVLAVGDTKLSGEKARRPWSPSAAPAKSMLFVSHFAGAVREMCDRALWIDHGSVVMDGQVNEVLDAYQGRMVMQQGL